MKTDAQMRRWADRVVRLTFGTLLTVVALLVMPAGPMHQRFLAVLLAGLAGTCWVSREE